MDQTLRLRIGGALPKGLMSQSNSSSGPPLHLLGSVGQSQGGSSGIHPNHFYQSSAYGNPRDHSSSSISASQAIGNQPLYSNPASHYQQSQLHQSSQLTSNSNFNSLDYSDAALSSRKTLRHEGGSQAAPQDPNVKRNNFLNDNVGGRGAHPEHEGANPATANSQPNPPTLRKITLNQRIL